MPRMLCGTIRTLKRGDPGGWFIMTTFIPWSPYGSPSWREYTISHTMAKQFGWINDDLSENPAAKLDKRLYSAGRQI